MPRNGVRDDFLSYIRQLAEARDSGALCTIIEVVIDEIAREIDSLTPKQEEKLGLAGEGADALINIFEFGHTELPDPPDDDDWGNE